MDNRPIGFFDSGLGGLTCIPYLVERMPNERIIYFGDTARTPYGSKAVSTIKTFSTQIADFLVKQDVKMIVIACNTVSSTCIEDLQNRFPEIPVLSIIVPAVSRLAMVAEMGERVGIIGTKVTVSSGAYSKLLVADRKNKVKISTNQYLTGRKDLSVFEIACPAFVPLIEEGIVENEIMDLTIKHYLDDFINDNNIGTLVLGCTHYPLIRKNIEKLYPAIKIINPSEAVA
ncbi:MAG: glutamate racemase, partial [Anaerovoracaceae bacterium]